MHVNDCSLVLPYFTMNSSLCILCAPTLIFINFSLLVYLPVPVWTRVCAVVQGHPWHVRRGTADAAKGAEDVCDPRFVHWYHASPPSFGPAQQQWSSLTTSNPCLLTPHHITPVCERQLQTGSNWIFPVLLYWFAYCLKLAPSGAVALASTSSNWISPVLLYWFAYWLKPVPSSAVALVSTGSNWISPVLLYWFAYWLKPAPSSAVALASTGSNWISPVLLYWFANQFKLDPASCCYSNLFCTEKLFILASEMIQTQSNYILIWNVIKKNYWKWIILNSYHDELRDLLGIRTQRVVQSDNSMMLHSLYRH